MFLGYQENNGTEFIAGIADTREDLEEDIFMKFSRIVETTKEYKLVDGSYITVEEAFEKSKESKRNEINTAREQARINEGAEYDDDLFDIDETSQSNILAQIKVAELLNNAKATYIYRSKTNQNHSFTVSQLQELGLAIAQKVNEIYQKSWELKAQVDDATTEDELNKITW